MSPLENTGDADDSVAIVLPPSPASTPAPSAQTNRTSATSQQTPVSEFDDAFGQEPLPPPKSPSDPRVQQSESDRRPLAKLIDEIDRLVPRPLPAKPHGARNVFGNIVGVISPHAGEAILHPGHRDQLRKWQADNELLERKAALENKAYGAVAHESHSRAETARAAAQNKLGQKYDAERDYVGKKPIIVPRNSRLSTPEGTVLLESLPPKETPGIEVEIGPDGRYRPVMKDGSAQIPGNIAPALFNSNPRVSSGYHTLKQSIRDANPEWEDHEIDAEASRLEKAKRDADLAAKQSQATRNNRLPAGRSSGLTAGQQAAQEKNRVNEIALVEIDKNGGVDQAIKGLESWPERDETAERVLTHLKAMRAQGAIRRKLSGGWRGKSSTSTKPVTPSNQSVNNPKPQVAAGTIEDGYRFKGGNPADPSAWEKVQ